LAHEVASLLLELSIGVHHFAMYPPDHPSLEPPVKALMGRLSDVFLDRRTFSIGVAERRLVIEGAATDPGHTSLSDLAVRLHRHQLGAVSFHRGVKADEVREVLATLARDVQKEGTPIGLLPPEDFPEWDNVRLHRIGYEDLELKGAGKGGGGRVDRATALWLGLAQAAMPDEVLDDSEGPDGATLAELVKAHGGQQDETIAAYLRQLAYELRGARGQDAELVRQRLSDFLESLDDVTLDRIVSFGGSYTRRNRFVLDATQSLSLDSVLRIVNTAAARTEQGISQSMTRLLSKLAVHAERGTGEAKSMADTAVRDNIEALVQGWSLKDPNPSSYSMQLDAMSRSAPIFESPGSDQELIGAERIIQMALEVDADGPLVERGVADLLKERGVARVLKLLDKAPSESRVAERIRKRLSTTEQLRRSLYMERVDAASLEVLVDMIGDDAVDPLLDVMEDAESRSLRRMVFDKLAELGPRAAQRAVPRLRNAEWYVQRNILTLMHGLEELPEDFDPGTYIEHMDSRVRRAALPLALRSPQRREAALVKALRDQDTLMVRMALVELLKGIPEKLLPMLVDGVVMNVRRSEEIRVLGVKALAKSDQPLARDTLLRIAVAGRTIFGRPRFPPTSPLLVAALQALAEGWPDHGEAAAVLRRAKRSKDPEVRGALDPNEADTPEEEQPEVRP
jgi:hypothetical protein